MGDANLEVDGLWMIKEITYWESTEWEEKRIQGKSLKKIQQICSLVEKDRQAAELLERDQAEM